MNKIKEYFKTPDSIMNFKAYGTFLVLSIILFSPYFLSDGLLLARDQLPGYGGWTYFKSHLTNGVFPMWSDGHLAGMPSFDGLPGDSFYPFFFLGLFLFSIKILHPVLFFTHTVLSGIFAFHFLKSRMNLSHLPATLLGICYMLNTNFISHIYPGHTGKFYVLTWLPLGMYFLWGILEKGKIKNAVGLGFFVGICIFTSHVQLTYFVLMGFFVYVVGYLGIQLFSEKISISIVSKKFILFWIGIGLGVGIGAPILYPAMNFTSNYSARGDASHTTFEHATSWSSHPEEIASLFAPDFVGTMYTDGTEKTFDEWAKKNTYWGRNILKFNSEYPGIMVWVLGILGMVLFRRKKSWVGLSIVLLAIIFALGAHTPLFKLFFNIIPGVNKFRAPSMILFWVASALMVLSAYFLKDWNNIKESLDEATKRKWAKKLLITGGILGGFGLIGFVGADFFYNTWTSIFSGVKAYPRFMKPPNVDPKNWQMMLDIRTSSIGLGLLKFGIFSGGILALFSFYLKSQVNRQQLFLGLMAIAVVDLLWADWKFIQTIDSKPIFRKIPVYERLVKNDPTHYRVFDLPGSFRSDNEKGFYFFYGFKNVSGFYDNELSWYRDLHGGSQNFSNYMKGLQSQGNSIQGSKFLDMLNVKYLLFKNKATNQPSYIENASRLPHAFWISDIKTVDTSQMVNYMLSDEFNPRTTALVLPDDEEKLNSYKGYSRELVSGKVDYGNTEISIDINVPDKGVIVLSEIFYPKWKAKVDGKGTEIVRINYAFRGIPVSAGSHKITMNFISKEWRVGWIMFFISVILLTALYSLRNKSFLKEL